VPLNYTNVSLCCIFITIISQHLVLVRSLEFMLSSCPTIELRAFFNKLYYMGCQVGKLPAMCY